jgi:co-chaperonin GroES (HSP10)
MREVLVPAAGRLVVKPDKPPEKEGSLYLPAAHAKRPTWGKVLAISPEAAEKLVGVRANNEFCVGKTVAYEWGAGNTLTLKEGDGGSEVVELKTEDVLGVVKEE